MQTTPLRAVFYLRLSDSDDASTSIVRQEQDLRELATRERWTIETVLVDDGVSGGKTRDKAMEALRMLRDDEADVLATWKLDRFGRRGVRDVADVADATVLPPPTDQRVSPRDPVALDPPPPRHDFRPYRPVRVRHAQKAHHAHKAHA